MRGGKRSRWFAGKENMETIIAPAKPRVFFSDQLLGLKKAEEEFAALPGWQKALILMGLKRQAGMANFYSDQITNFRASPKTFLKPSELHGRARIARFTYTTPSASAPGVADLVAMTKVPKDSSVIAGWIAWEALSSGAGTAGADWGQATDDQGAGFAADFAAAVNMDSAGGQAFTPAVDKIPVATPYTSERYLFAKVTGEAWATTKKVQGAFIYVID